MPLAALLRLASPRSLSATGQPTGHQDTRSALALGTDTNSNRWPQHNASPVIYLISTKKPHRTARIVAPFVD